MNNGITIITRHLGHIRDRFAIRDFQIVNGCQTTHVLYGNQNELDASVLVPLRLIWSEDENVIQDIIHATNRQTEVKKDQFFAITDFARKLEAYFQSYEPQYKLYFERRSRQYDSLSIEKTRIMVQTNVVRSFAAMFLEEPHSTIRSYKNLSDKIGKEIFGQDHRPVAYYTAAFALYRFEWLFRNTDMDNAYKIARYQIIMAVRLLINSGPVPFMNSHAIEKYCASLLETLWDKDKATAVFEKAISVLNDISGGVLERDRIHSQAFTSSLKAKCVELNPKQAQPNDG